MRSGLLRRHAYTSPARVRTVRSRLADIATALALGAAAGVGLFYALSGGVCP